MSLCRGVGGSGGARRGFWDADMLCFLSGLLVTQVCSVRENSPSCTVNGSLRMYAVKGFPEQYSVGMALFQTKMEQY